MQSYHYEIRYPSLTEGVFRLILLFTITFLIQVIATIFSSNAFSQLSSMILASGSNFKIYSIFTHFFIYPINFSNFFNFLFEMLILWSFGSEIEQLWGTKNFYKYFFIGIYGGAISILLIGTFLLPELYAFSPTAGISALLLAYAILFPEREVLFFFVLPLKMKWVALILFLFLVIGSVNFLILNLGGAVFAGIYLYIVARRGRLKDEYNRYSTRASSQLNRILAEPSQTSLKEKVKNKISEFKKKRRLEKKRQEILRRIEMKEELDRILEKISKEGINSLTREEKKFLEKASKEL
jgi:membrane associated rhomboid family serine protease